MSPTEKIISWNPRKLDYMHRERAKSWWLAQCTFSSLDFTQPENFCASACCNFIYYTASERKRRIMKTLNAAASRAVIDWDVVCACERNQITAQQLWDGGTADATVSAAISSERNAARRQQNTSNNASIANQTEHMVIKNITPFTWFAHFERCFVLYY